jgi:phage repressor protein C with HTH and peptisase S24 domain
MKTYSERLVWAMGQALPPMSQSDLAKEISKLISPKTVSPQTIQHLCDQEKNATGSIHTPAIANILGVSELWLAYGIGQPSKIAGEATTPDSSQTPVKRVKFKLSAGISGFNVEIENDHSAPIFFRKDWFTLNGYEPNALFAVKIVGASMEPSLWDGDLVVVNTKDTTLYDGEAYAVNYEGEMVIKRMRRDSGEWWATSDNTDQRRFSPKRCTEDVYIIGRIVYKQSERV